MQSGASSCLIISLRTSIDIVDQQGYISIFPFLLGLLEPDSPNLGAILKAVRDPAQMWTDFGLRSLSRDHPLYGTGEDYWRSPIWIPINYLALQSLYTVCRRLRLLIVLPHAEFRWLAAICQRARPVSTTGCRDLRRTTCEYSKKCSQGIRPHWLCMGAVRCRYRRGQAKVRLPYCCIPDLSDLPHLLTSSSHPFTGVSSFLRFVHAVDLTFFALISGQVSSL